MKTGRSQIEPYITKDGSAIRELIHPSQGSPSGMSLAEATVSPSCKTLLHVHASSEEIYHVTQGTGRMMLGPEEFEIGQGDSILIRPGTPHRVENTGDSELVILCCCCPPYSHGDTVLVDDRG